MEISANNIILEEDIPSRRKRKQSQELVKLNASSKKGFIKNARHNANKELLKTVGFGILGAVIYPLVPTLFQSIMEKDMSGAKGLFMGVGCASLLGLSSGKPAITIGAISAAGTHLLYSKGTKIVEDTFNTQIFRMNPNSVVYENN